jgi:hypothetical protein
VVITFSFSSGIADPERDALAPHQPDTKSAHSV